MLCGINIGLVLRGEAGKDLVDCLREIYMGNVSINDTGGCITIVDAMMTLTCYCGIHIQIREI
jgi:hypothetical protein